MAEQLWDMTTTGFGPETLIETTEGPVPMEWLSRTHHLVTRDNGAQPIRAIEKHILSPMDGAYVPLVVIEQDGMGQTMPDHPLILPPQHQIFLQGPEISLHFGFDQCLCETGFLVGGMGIRPFNSGTPVALHTILTSRPEIIRTNGIWTETKAPVFDDNLTAADKHHLSDYPCLIEWEGRLIARGNFNAAAWPAVAAA